MQLAPIPGVIVHETGTLWGCSAFWGYVAGLGTTIFVMNYFDAAQPALLYIVPGVLGAVALHALYQREFLKVNAPVTACMCLYKSLLAWNRSEQGL